MQGGMNLVAHITEEEPRREETVAEHTKKTEYLCREKGKRCGIAELMSREFDTLKFKKVLQSLEIGLFFCQTFCFII